MSLKSGKHFKAALGKAFGIWGVSQRDTFIWHEVLGDPLVALLRDKCQDAFNLDSRVVEIQWRGLKIWQKIFSECCYSLNLVFLPVCEDHVVKSSMWHHIAKHVAFCLLLISTLSFAPPSPLTKWCKIYFASVISNPKCIICSLLRCDYRNVLPLAVMADKPGCKWLVQVRVIILIFDCKRSPRKFSSLSDS